MIGQCKLGGIYFAFFLPRSKKETPSTLQHISKPPQANAQTKGLKKSCNSAYAQVHNCYI
ncbi:hypothetical protein NC99_17290 [Sunxiuqinia dokdonensis]|uniref:Uncharacterized protein n=1 Tax=Sunxiuqinia dokdonensis TaxID=1409788 RepID=A0A0L8VB79_9BACT|nr:hypothetical protein NC99_17290 [Sunxiuqinia dokdonensis]